MICPNCNHEIDDNSNFCRFCGFNVEVIEDQSKSMYCPNCGRLIESNSKFCSYCGVKITPIIPETSLEDYLSCAKIELNAQNYTESLELYCKAYDLDNVNKEALFGIIKSFYMLEEYGKTIVYSFKYLKIDETNEEVLNYKLCSEININNFSLAKKTINDLLDISKDDIDLLFKKIDILKNLDENNEIIKVYDEILTIDNDRDDVYFEKSKLLFDESKYEDALKSIDFAININPLSEYKIFKNTIEKKSIKHIDRYSLRDAKRYFNDYNYPFANEILSNFNDYDSLELKCNCLYMMGRNKDALNILNQLLTIKKDDNDFVDLKAKIYLAMGDKFNSIKYFKEAVKLNKAKCTDLAFAYGRFGDIELSKKYYSQVDNELSQIWLDYYNESESILISGLQNDFFNYPHLICLKINMYIKNSVSYFNQNNLKKTLKYLKLSEKYLDKLEGFIGEYKLNNSFVASNYYYLEKILEQYKVINFEKFKNADEEIFSRFLDVLDRISKYYDMDTVHYLKINSFLADFYKSLAKSFIYTSSENALRYFKRASLHINSDGETWLYIANLSDENKIALINKALFCFDRKLETTDDDKYLKLKGMALYYLNREREAIDILKSCLPKRYTDEKIKKYIEKSMESYSGGYYAV